MKILKRLCIFFMLFVLLGGCTDGNKNSTHKKGGTEETIYLEMRKTDTLDPLKTDKQSVRDVLASCYEPLFVLNSDISPKGVIAKGWSMDDLAKEVTVSLKEDILWHDGKPLTADDVVYTVNQIKKNENSQYKFAVKYVESVTALNSHKVKFKLNRSYAQFIYSLNFPIVPAHEKNLDEKIVGTGAYTLEEYVQGDLLKLKKFNNWHGADAQTPKIEISIVRDDEAASALFTSGMLSAITSKSLDLSNYALKKNDICTYYPSPQYEYMAFNHSKKLFVSAGVRGAISNAIDRNELIEECYGGRAESANIPLHPSGKDIAPSPTLAAYDLGSAMEMLFYEGYSINEKTGLLTDEEGKNAGFTLLVNSDNPQRCKCAEKIASQLLKAGITVKISREDYDIYKEKIKRCEYDAYLAGTVPGNIYDFEFLLSDGGELNNYGYSGRYMNLALSNMASSPSRDSFEDAALNFEEVFVREQPICGIAFMKNVLVSKSRLRGNLSPQFSAPFAHIYDWEIFKK